MEGRVACVICGNDAGYNRAAVDVYRDEEIGRLCMTCERAEFGKSLTYTDTGAAAECTFCRRDGQVSFPRFLPAARAAGPDVVVKSHLENADGAPQLCGEHFHAVTEAEETPPTARL